ncbi:MAG: Lrp/AsnC family transcriptional regulator [Thiothrix sp.]|nr:MAG: Lrp/AsnC family transcriptional regulator [Thiothrix sp.]
MSDAIDPELQALDRRIVLATQSGLPLDPQPYHRIAEQLNVDVALVKERLSSMLRSGKIRRIAAVPNHYKLGFSANGMSVWNVPDERISELGRRLGDLEFVSHCYHRPRHPPEWMYNLFAMVHGRDRSEVEDKVEQIASLLGEDCLGHDVLFSTRILKKTGFRLKE